MNSKQVSSIAEYLEVISILTDGLTTDLWYRGVGSLSYDLLPGIHWSNNRKYESTYIHQFLVGYKAYSNFQSSNPWDIYALMQHHGLRTRLLDWTKSPLNALFFALTQNPEIETERGVYIMFPHLYNDLVFGEDAIYCPAALPSRKVHIAKKIFDIDSYLPKILDPNDNRQSAKVPLAIESPLNHSRIKSQNGCFTIHGSIAKPLDFFIESDSKAISLLYFDLSTERKKLLSELNAYGVNEETIFQDLDHLTARINRGIESS